MPLKKSELYSSLWASCDELRGGTDASQYKDYVLVLLFVKYVSDRFAGQPFAAITVPKGASFADMVALKGKPDIGDQINKKILGPLAQANQLSDMPDFNDPNKLGSGKEMVDRLGNLIAIFENPALDFSKNRADGDDLLGETPTNTSCGTSPRRAARARVSSTRPPKSAASSRRFSASATPRHPTTPPSMTQFAAAARCL
jgi:type I restriction enzyme M protein